MASVSFSFSAEMSTAETAIPVGYAVCADAVDGTRFVVATSANLAAIGGVWAGVAGTAASAANASFTILPTGIVPADITGLGAGAATAVSIAADGSLQRGSSTYNIGTCDTSGNMTFQQNATPASLPTGAADEVLVTNSTATASIFAKLVDANVSATAAIAGTKISPAFGSQNVSNTGTVSIGSTVATTGTIRVGNNSTIIAARNAADTGNIALLSTNGSDGIIVGDASSAATGEMNAPTYLDIYTASLLLKDAAGVTALSYGIVPAGASTMTFAATCTPSITQSSTTGATGAKFTIRAQQSTNGSGVGGDLVLSGGAGSTEANRGKVEIVGPLTGSVDDSLPFRHGVSSIVFSSDANKTLTAAEYANPALMISGTITATRDLIVPLTSGSIWFARNDTAQSVRIIGSSGTGVTIPTATSAVVIADGTNIVKFMADGPTGSAGSAATRYVKVFTTSTSWTVPAGVNALEHVLLRGGGGSGGSGAGGAGGSSGGGGNSGGGGSGGDAGSFGAYAYVSNYPVTPAASVTVTIGAGGVAVSGGAGGSAGNDGTNGTDGNAGGASSFGSLTVAGGAGGALGNKGLSGGTGGASPGGTAGAGGNGTSSGAGAAGGSSTTGTVNRTPLYGTTTQTLTYGGSLTGNSGASGGAAGSAGTLAGGGGGGAGGAVQNFQWTPATGVNITAQSPSAGGAGGSGTGPAAGSNGAAPTGTSSYGAPGCGGSGGGGGGYTGASGGAGGAGGSSGAGAAGFCVISYVVNTDLA